MLEPQRPLVIGIGNPDRRDDGCGPEVARRLSSRVGAAARVEGTRGDPMALLDRWDRQALVYVVDAVRSGRAAGTVRRIEVTERTAPASVGGTSTHGLSLGESIGLGRALNRMPGRLIVYGIEVGRVDLGEGFSPPVAAAIEEVVERLADELSSSPGVAEATSHA